MFKVDEDGIIYEFGNPIELTEEDRLELKEEIVKKCQITDLTKRSGKWSHQTSKDIIESNFRIVLGPEDEDAPTYTEQLDQAVNWKQVMDIQEHG